MIKAVTNIRTVQHVIADCKNKFGANIMFKKITADEFFDRGGCVSVLKDRNHSFQHDSILKWAEASKTFLRESVKQWMADSVLLEEMLNGFTADAPAAVVAKPDIMEKENAALRQALLSNKSYKPCRNGTSLLARWRTHLRNLLTHGCLMPDGLDARVRAMGLCVNASLDWCELVEMVHELITVSGERNLFLREATFSS